MWPTCPRSLEAKNLDLQYKASTSSDTSSMQGLYNGGRCKFGAAVCEYEDHLPDTATRELLDWIKRHNIKSTVTSIFSAPTKTIAVNKNFIHPNTTDLSKNARNKLQLGKNSASFTNDQLRDLFAKDLKIPQDLVCPMPEGEVSFVFCKIKGKKNGIQAFVDSGCNCAIFKDGIPRADLISYKIQEGPIPIDVATGVVVNALGEWASAIPLANGSYQVMRALTVKKVTSDMPKFRLRNLLDNLKSEPAAEENDSLKIFKFLKFLVERLIFVSVFSSPRFILSPYSACQMV